MRAAGAAGTTVSPARSDARRGAVPHRRQAVCDLSHLDLATVDVLSLTWGPIYWDLSELEGLAGEAAVGSGLADPDSFENKLYGDVWLLLRIAELRGVTRDLMTVFFHQAEVVNDVLTLAIYPYLTGRSLSRLPRWQRSVKVPATHELTPSRVTRLTQSVTHDQVMEFFRLRIARQPGGAYYACDSTTRTAWGTHVAEIRYGRNKDNRDRDCTLEVVVYSLTAHEPVYYRTFPGNMPDARTVRTIVKDLSEPQAGLMGIPEPPLPADGTKAPEPDLILVPCVAASPGGIRLEELHGENLVAFNTSGQIRGEMDRIFRERGIRPNIIAETENDQIIYGLVAAGRGVAIVPYPLTGAPYNTELVPIAEGFNERRIYLQWNKNRYMTPAAKYFRDYVIRSGQVFDQYRELHGL